MDIFPFEPIFAYDSLSILQKVWLRLIDSGGFKDVYKNSYFSILKRYAVSLMHCHFGYCGVEFLGLKNKLQLPLVTSFYGADMSLLPRDPIWRDRMSVLFDEGDLFLVEGAQMKAALVELGCPESRLVVQHLGVDLDVLPMLPRQMGADGMIRILVAGTFREKKGITYALEAFARVRQKHKNIRLTLMGDASDAPRDQAEKQRIFEVLDTHNLGESVTLLGFQPHAVFLKELLRHHLLLSPSVLSKDGDSEGGAPVSITEAQATGMPVVSTFHADIPEVVVDGKTGLLSPERDLEALTDNLEFLVAHPEGWGKMGQQGRSHIENEYDVKILARKLQTLYSRVLST